VHTSSSEHGHSLIFILAYVSEHRYTKTCVQFVGNSGSKYFDKTSLF
jgi:hypothetical protein